MRRFAFFLSVLCLSIPAFAGFKPKIVKPKKPDQFQARVTQVGVTYAADLLLDGKDQKDYFYKELTPSSVIAVRLAVFNAGKEEVLLPLDGLQLIDADGKEIPLVAPETVAEAVLRGMVVTAQAKDKKPVAVSPNIRYGDPRYDRGDPRYDPRMDPTDPSYDPNDPQNRRYGRSGTYGPYARPGIDVVMNPGGAGGGGDLSQFEKKLVEKDFQDKAHAPEPIPNSMNRDKFLYFSIPTRPPSARGFTLRLPRSKGIPQEIALKF